MLVQLRTEVSCADATLLVMGCCELTAAQAAMVEAALAVAAEGPNSAAAALPDCLQVCNLLCTVVQFSAIMLVSMFSYYHGLGSV